MTVRLALALLFVVPAAMAYPWPSTADRWVMGVAITVMVMLFTWWRGLFVTTMIARRIAILRRRSRTVGSHQSSECVTRVLRVAPAVGRDVPIDLLTGYLDRYGMRFDKLRVISRDIDGIRTTWIAVTLAAADNIAALSARSSRIPLQDSAELAERRMADHLREEGWEVAVDDSTPTPVSGDAKETWRGVADGHGYLAAYRIAVDDTLPDTLDALRAGESPERWTVLEFSGTRTAPAVSAACAIRSRQKPGARAPLAGLALDRGMQGPALAALAPDSGERLVARPLPVPEGLLTRLRWPADSERLTPSV